MNKKIEMTFNKYNDYKEHFKHFILRKSKLSSYETDYFGNRLIKDQFCLLRFTWNERASKLIQSVNVSIYDGFATKNTIKFKKLQYNAHKTMSSSVESHLCWSFIVNKMRSDQFSAWLTHTRQHTHKTFLSTRNILSLWDVTNKTELICQFI